MFDEKLNLILSDNTSGSTELLQNLIEYFLQNPNNIQVKLLVELKNYFKSFQNITKLLSNLQNKINSSSNIQMIEYLKNYSAQTTDELNLLFYNSLPYLKKFTKFITISNSKTLQFIFSNLKNSLPDLEITILESRPQFEGRILAKYFISQKIIVNIITEAMAANAVEACDAVVIGSDKILSNNNVVNKTGSRNLAILSKYFCKPFFVLATKNKFTNTNDFENDYHNPSEIWDLYSKNLNIRNYYFEKIESSLITKIITN